MANSRKDKRGYVLRTGECQRTDGRYSYSYTDKYGERHVVYAKDLAELRKKERKIIRDMEDGIDTHAPEKITLNQLYDKYISLKVDLKPTTRANYKYMYDHFVRPKFGRRKIADIKYTDVKKFYYDLIMNKEMKAYTLDNVHTQIHPTLQMAVRDGLLRTNPSDGVMAEIKKSHVWDKEPRRALTIPQQRAFTGYMQNSREYHGWVPVIMILFGTGMRIGECLGLRWEDLNFESRTISVNHNLSERPYDDGTCTKHIQTPKTKAGTRTIPMIDEVFDAFLQEYEMQKCMGYRSETIDGYTNFVFLTTGGSVLSASSVNRAIHGITDSYNAEEIQKAKEEKREPVLIPNFSAHSLRHTFCTRLCENESNLKVIQSVMGHSDITTTMDIYAEATDEKKQEIMANLQGKIIV